jgi:hypothetical protein
MFGQPEVIRNNRNYEIDLPRLFVQWVVLTAAIGGFYLYEGRERGSP